MTNDRQEHPRPLTVVIADDATLFRLRVRSIIEEEPGMIVAGEARDGEEAVEIACDVQPDVVVLDVGMPRVNGIEATARLREILPDAAVVGLSSYHDPAVAEAMLAAGASVFLLKSTGPDRLCAAIRDAARRSGE